MSLEEACAAPIPDSDSGSEGLDCEDVSACVGDGETRRVWSPGAQVLATSDIECIDRTFAEPEVVVLRKGHLGRVVGLDVDCNLLVQWDELDSPKSARYDQLQSKDPGADVWGSWSVCGFWANVHGHLWICPDPSNPEQCFYEEAPQDGGFLHGTLKMDQQGHGGVEPAWWLAEVWAEPGEYETPEDAETSETLSHDLENHFSIGMIRLRLSRANRLEVQISADGGDWSEMRELDRQLPKIDWPLQILRSDGQTDCTDATDGTSIVGSKASFCRKMGFSLQIQVSIPQKGELWYVATVSGVPMPKLTLETSTWKIQACAPPQVELQIDGLQMDSKYDVHVALMVRSVLEYRGVSVEVVTSRKVKTFCDNATLSNVWYFVRNDGLDEPYCTKDQITLESEWCKMQSSESPQFLGTVQCQNYTVNLRTMKQTREKTETERDVKRRPLSLVSDAPVADVCLWQLVAQYRSLVTSREKWYGIDASLKKLDNAEMVAKLMLHAETKVLLQTHPGLIDGVREATDCFNHSQDSLRDSLQTQNDQNVGTYDDLLKGRDCARQNLCSTLKQSAETITSIEAFVKTAAAATEFFEDPNRCNQLKDEMPELCSLQFVDTNFTSSQFGPSGASAATVSPSESMMSLRDLLSRCRAQLRNLRLQEVEGLGLSTATDNARSCAVESLRSISRALEDTSTSVPFAPKNAALGFAKAMAQEEEFRGTASQRRKEFEKLVDETCALARVLLRKIVGVAQADLGTLAEHVRLAEKHEHLLSKPPKQNELHDLEDDLNAARDLHLDNLERERRLEREHRTGRRRMQTQEVDQRPAEALQKAQSASADSRRAVQQAEERLRRRLMDFVRVKQAPWGLPELRLNVDDEHLEAVDVLTPGRRCDDYEDLVALPCNSNSMFTAMYNGEPCVLKEIRSTSQSGALRREVLHRKKLKHPLVVPVLAAFEEEDKGRSIAYIHMPRYPCNLEEWCSGQTCSLSKMRQVLRDVVLAVAYVHSQNVVHGDLKPSNFLMDSEDRPCLTDFETSQCVDGQSLQMRRTTLVVGATQGFTPPEFPNLSAESDIYSLGCICDHLLHCWEKKWPHMGTEQRKAIGKLAQKMTNHRKDDRPTAVAVLADMTTAMKAEAVEAESLPPYWQNAAVLKCEVRKEDLGEWQNGLTTFQQLESALFGTVHDSCRAEFFADSSPSISFVQRVENPQLWRRYCLAKEKVAGALSGPINPPVRASCPMIDFTRNEYWLWHGTRYSNIDAILKEGLDEHLSRMEGLYGAGIYFSDEACKALQYSDRGPHYLLFCRVVLGKPYYTKNTLPSMRSLKELKSRPGLLETPDAAGHDSLIVNPGPVQNHPSKSGKQVHREFVIFDGAAVYPEYVVGIDQ